MKCLMTVSTVLIRRVVALFATFFATAPTQRGALAIMAA